MAKATSLITAYQNNELPEKGGFIISGNFDPDSTYSIFEITAYVNVKDIYHSPEGWVFKTDGNRAHMLVEPATYSKRHIEPVHREEGRSIPYRFNEMEVLTGKRQEKIMVSLEPVMLYSSFTILEPTGYNYSFIFYLTEDVYLAMRKFIADSLYNDCNLTKADAMEGSKLALNTIKKFSLWDG